LGCYRQFGAKSDEWSLSIYTKNWKSEINEEHDLPKIICHLSCKIFKSPGYIN
jgi:hypothetical protein